jgi:hypothetical protein
MEKENVKEIKVSFKSKTTNIQEAGCQIFMILGIAEKKEEEMKELIPLLKFNKGADILNTAPAGINLIMSVNQLYNFIKTLDTEDKRVLNIRNYFKSILITKFDLEPVDATKSFEVSVSYEINTPEGE